MFAKVGIDSSIHSSSSVLDSNHAVAVIEIVHLVLQMVAGGSCSAKEAEEEAGEEA